MCWIISILLISDWWYESHIDAQYSKTGIMNCLQDNILYSFEYFFSGILITYLLCYKQSLSVGAKINDGPA